MTSLRQRRSPLILLPILAFSLLALRTPGPAHQPELDDPEQIERRAEELYAADRLEEAAALYLRLADLVEPAAEQARALVLAAWLQTLRGRPDVASRTLEDALARDPGYQIDPQGFSESFQHAFEQARASRGGGARGGGTLDEGIRLLQSGDLIGARTVFEQAAAADPGDARVQFLLARIESRLGESASAVSRLRALGARLDGGEPLGITRPQIDSELGIIAYRSGDPRGAEAAFARAVAASPEDIAAWHNLGLSRDLLGELEGAAEAFRRALALDQQPELVRLLANTLLRLDRDAEALPLLRELAGAGSQDPRVFLDLGIAQRGTGGIAAAADAFTRAAELDASNELEVGAFALGQHAAMMLEAGQPRRAAELARAALAMDRGDVDALNVLGLALLENGEQEEAALQLERARALAPQRADIANNLGKALFVAERLDEAVEAFEAALELDPDLRTARENLEVARSAATGGDRPASPGSGADGRPASEASSGPPREPIEPARLGATFADVRHAGTGRDAVEVLSVTAGGLAERSGLRAGDLILRVDGRGIGTFGLDNAAAFVRRLGELEPGESVRLDLFRAREALAVTFAH